MSQTGGKLVVHHRSQGAAVASLDGFFLMRCFGDVSAADVYASVVAQETILAFRAEGPAAVVVIDPTVTFPTDETRRAALEVTRKTGGKTVAHVVVVRGDGFWASTVRGIMVTISSISSSNHPRKVVRHEEEAVDWVLDVLKESPQKYRQLLLTSLAELKADATPPKSPSKLP